MVLNLLVALDTVLPRCWRIPVCLAIVKFDVLADVDQIVELLTSVNFELHRKIVARLQTQKVYGKLI